MTEWLLYGIVALLGCIVGSFCNVVIARLPRMLETQWQYQEDCVLHQRQGLPAPAKPPTFNLATPASHCPQCGSPIRWYHNLPIISYAMLRGRCAHCHHSIGWQYPAVEVITAVLALVCYALLGWQLAALLWFGWCASLVCLALIDARTQYLPDQITLPLLWVGLLASAMQYTHTPLPHAVWGAALGYSSLWLIAFCFEKLTGLQGMGYGDFKLYAALGAWLGAPALLPVMVFASVLGACYGITAKLLGRLQAQQTIPFGPFLAIGGLLTWLLPWRTWLGWLG